MTWRSPTGPRPSRTSPRPAAARSPAGPGPRPSARRHRHTSRNRHSVLSRTTHAGAPDETGPPSDLNLSTSVSPELEPRRREPAVPLVAPPRRQRVHQPQSPAALCLIVSGRGGRQDRDAIPAAVGTSTRMTSSPTATVTVTTPPADAEPLCSTVLITSSLASKGTTSESTGLPEYPGHEDAGSPDLLGDRRDRHALAELCRGHQGHRSFLARPGPDGPGTTADAGRMNPQLRPPRQTNDHPLPGHPEAPAHPWSHMPDYAQPSNISSGHPARTIPIGLDLCNQRSRPSGSRYQHRFSTRSGNGGKQPG